MNYSDSYADDERKVIDGLGLYYNLSNPWYFYKLPEVDLLPESTHGEELSRRKA